MALKVRNIFLYFEQRQFEIIYFPSREVSHRQVFVIHSAGDQLLDQSTTFRGEVNPY